VEEERNPPPLVLLRGENLLGEVAVDVVGGRC
jgi:hypothetical protein